MEILYGIHPVAECIRAGRRGVRRLMVADEGRMKELESVIGKAVPAKAERCGKDACFRRSGNPQHQGVVAEVEPYPYVDWRELLKPNDNEAPFLLALDGLTDTHNVGAILRSALCAGVTGITLRNHHAALVTATVAKASAGACEHLRIALVSNQTMFLKAAGKEGFLRAGLDMNGDSIWRTDIAWNDPLVIVIGEEGKGVSRLVSQACDATWSIPMKGGLDSLNASVAAAVTLFEVARNRERLKRA